MYNVIMYNVIMELTVVYYYYVCAVKLVNLAACLVKWSCQH